MTSLKLRLESLEGRDCPAPLLAKHPTTDTVATVQTAPTTTDTTFSVSLHTSSKIKPPTTTTSPTPVGDKVIAFAEAHLGQVVTAPNATGCAALASAALSAAGAAPPKWVVSGPISDHYSWGTLVYQRSLVTGFAKTGLLTDVRPGDVIQVDQYAEKRPDGSWISADHHTAIVESVNATTGQITVIQQNWNGNPAATRGTFIPDTMTSGVMSIYRPTSL